MFNTLQDKFGPFILFIIKACEYVNWQKRKCVDKSAIILPVLLLRSTASEVMYAHSKASFTAKLQIVLKECFKDKYWPVLLLGGRMVTLLFCMSVSK